MSPVLDDGIGGSDPMLDAAEEPWTYVTRKKGAQNKKTHGPRRSKNSSSFASATRRSPATTEGDGADADTDAVPPNPSPQLSVADIAAEHAQVRSRWNESTAYQTLRKLIADNLKSHTAVNRAVCLGLGSFDPATGSWEARRRSHVQLEAFLDVVECIAEPKRPGAAASSSTPPPLRCYFQEPGFTDADKEFLHKIPGERGWHYTAAVVDSPRAFEMVDSATLVFGVHLYKGVYARALGAGDLPAMVICTSWDVWEDNAMVTGKSLDALEKLRKLDETFDKLAFPQDGHHTFSGTCIYWERKSETEGTEDKVEGADDKDG